MQSVFLAPLVEAKTRRLMEAYMVAILVTLVLVTWNVLEVSSQNFSVGRDMSGSKYTDVCGRSVLSYALVHNGDNVEKGEWPWLAALYVTESASLAFKCGAVLVTASHVVTAGHCVHPPKRLPISTQKFVVGFGIHNIFSLGDEEKGLQSRRLSRIVIHPEFNKPKDLDNDIAILVLTSPVTFTDIVRPVCLWSARQPPPPLTRSTGTVVGWGRTDSDEISNDGPKKVTMPIASQEECLWSNVDFVHITSTNTFCAGNRDGSGPCKGDSGGGLYQSEVFGNSQRWVLRGLVSTALASAGDCDLTNYVVFTDVAKFSNWLLQTITGISQPSATPPSLAVQILGDNQPRSISEKKCIEYTKYVRRKVTVQVNLERISHTVPECEFRNVPLIVGGSDVVPGEFPHMVAIYHKESEPMNAIFICGGTLISDNFVLTSGKCTMSVNQNLSFVRLGELSRQHDIEVRLDGDMTHSVEVAVAQVIPHPQYRPPVLYNDIGLIRLARHVTFSINVRPACLPQASPNDNARVVATGWGVTDLYVDDPSNSLRKVTLRLVPDESCAREWASVVERVANPRLPRGIDHETMMCAGERGKDTCSGDSGSPLTIRDEKNECVHHVVGVTSFRKALCGFGINSIYTRVSYYVPWMESVVWPE